MIPYVILKKPSGKQKRIWEYVIPFRILEQNAGKEKFFLAKGKVYGNRQKLLGNRNSLQETVNK